MSRHITLEPREEHPPRWALVLLALAIIAALAGLFRWLQLQDKQNRVAGRPAKFDRGPEAQPEAQQPEVQQPEEPRAEARQPEAPRPEARQPEAQQPEASRLVVNLKMLLEAPDKKALVGRQVVLEDARVQQVVGDAVFWVGPGARSRVPVVLLGELMQRQPESRVEVHEGERVRVFGVVRELRDVETLDTSGLLSSQQREELRRAGVFISAQRVVTLGP